MPTLDPSPSTPSPVARRPRRTPLYVHIAAWAIPVLVLTQFAMVAIVPVLIVVVASLADARVRALRWYTALIGALYATPLIIWAVRPDGAQSLSKDMHPAFIALIVAASVLLTVKIYTRRRP